MQRGGLREETGLSHSTLCMYSRSWDSETRCCEALAVGSAAQELPELWSPLIPAKLERSRLQVLLQTVSPQAVDADQLLM